MSSPEPPFTPVPSLTPGSLIYSPKVRQASVVRKQIGQFEPDQVGIRILNKKTELIDPDPGSLRVEIRRSVDYSTGDGPGTPLLAGTEGDGIIERLDVGIFRAFLGTNLTAEMGLFEVHWHYRVASQEFFYIDYYQVQEPMPVYSALSDDEKGLVEQVSWMFGDLYDSTEGGPHLIDEFQTHFGFERIAQLAHIGLNRINFTKQPMTTFTIGGGSLSGMNTVGGFRGPMPSAVPPRPFPVAWYGLLIQSTYIEVIKHLMRSYVEQPLLTGLSVAIADRRDYLDRWNMLYTIAETEFTEGIRFFKREQLNLGGGGSLIVSGGIWGRGRFYGNTYSAEVRGYRFFPASFAAGFGLGH